MVRIAFVCDACSEVTATLSEVRSALRLVHEACCESAIALTEINFALTQIVLTLD